MIHLDYETTSLSDLAAVGSYRYACDPSTRILMFAVAEDDGDPYIWNFLEPMADEPMAAISLLRNAVKDGIPIYAHNAMFEAAMSMYRLREDTGVGAPALEQWRCTAAMCRTAAIPYSLAKAAEFLDLGIDKDARGKALIGAFSDQNKLVTIRHGKESRKSASPILENPIPWDWTFTVAGEQVTVRDAWTLFCDYCRQDVRVEQRIHKALAKFEITGTELEGFQFDLRMNTRGVPVNVKALDHAITIIDGHRDTLEQEFVALTGLMPSQTAKVLEWLRAEGYPADNLQGSTMDEWVGSSMLTPTGQRALEIRSQLSFAAVKKIPKMKEIACDDGRMRGQFMWYGASATGRWSSQGAQLQNIRKPSINDPDAAYGDICDEVPLWLIEFLYGNPYEVVASCARNFVQPEEGMLLDIDFSNIESRVAAMIAGQADLLDTYRQGRDAYKELAAMVYGVRVEDVTKEQRFVGKVGNLSLVFQTGAKTFHETCATWGMPIEKAIACKTVRTFRETNDQFPITWRKFEWAATQAIKKPGEWFKANDFVSFACSNTRPFKRLMMLLPSGRKLCYPLPVVKRTVKSHKDYETGEVREWESDDITFYGPLKGHVGWGRTSIYAGSIFQSAVQATARDILQYGCVEAEKQDFEAIAVIHDQCLAHDGDFDKFKAAFCSMPPWLPSDFPLAAEGGRVPYYSKT